MHVQEVTLKHIEYKSSQTWNIHVSLVTNVTIKRISVIQITNDIALSSMNIVTDN